MQINSGISLLDMERFFHKLYGRRNRIYLSGLADRVGFLYLAIGDLQEAIRKRHSQKVLERALARIVARIFCISENFGSLPLVEVLLQKYPADKCSYCQKLPCSCPQIRPESQLAEETMKLSDRANWSLREWQDHLNKMYGHQNRLHGPENVVNRLFHEAGEILSLQLRIPRLEMSTADIEKEFALEIVDALAWTIGIANLFEINLEKSVIQRFGQGCSSCKTMPCGCTHFNMVPVKWEKCVELERS